jgi:SPP1 gp7 family putative phage head morphogenesis protein
MSLLSRIKAAYTGFIAAGLGARRVSTDMPDWALQFLNHAFWLTEKQLGHIDAFLLVGMVNAAVTQVQDDYASLPCKVYQGRAGDWKEIERSYLARGIMLRPRPDDLAELIHRPNPNETGRMLRAALAGSLELTGNGYLFLQYFGSNPVPQEMWLLQGQLTRPVPGIGRTMAGYEFNSTGSGDWSFIPAFDEKRRPLVIPFRRYNPKDEPIGLAAIEALEGVYSGRYYAFQWLKTFFLKGGVLSGIWSPEAGTAPLKEAEVKAWIDKLKRTHLGYDKAWNPIIMESLKFVRQGMKLSEMELDKQIGIMDAEIMRALGVPPVVMGVKEGGGLSDAGSKVDLQLYWHGKQKRLAQSIDEVLTERLAPLFGQSIEVETDLGEVLVVQNDRLDQAKAHVALVDGGVETPDEARIAIGYPPMNTTESKMLRVPQAAPALGPLPLARVREVEAEVVAPRSLPRKRALMIEGDANREALRLKHSRALDKAQSRMHALVLARLDEQRATVKSRLAERWAAANPATMARAGKAVKLATAIDISNLIPEGSEEDRAKAEAILRRLLQERTAEALKELAALIDAAVEADVALNSARVIRFLEMQMERAITLPDQTTAEGLRRVLQEGIAQGEGLAGLTARVDQFFDGRRANALTIARTEVLPGYNFGAREAWMQAGVAEVEWLSARDDAVRPAHAEADGQTAPVDGAFEVGGESLQYPGDPSGSPELTINCRCVLIPVVDTSALSRQKWDGFWHAHANGNGKPASPEFQNRLRSYFKQEA